MTMQHLPVRPRMRRIWLIAGARSRSSLYRSTFDWIYLSHGRNRLGVEWVSKDGGRNTCTEQVSGWLATRALLFVSGKLSRMLRMHDLPVLSWWRDTCPGPDQLEPFDRGSPSFFVYNNAFRILSSTIDYALHTLYSAHNWAWVESVLVRQVFLLNSSTTSTHLHIALSFKFFNNS